MRWTFQNGGQDRLGIILPSKQCDELLQHLFTLSKCINMYPFLASLDKYLPSFSARWWDYSDKLTEKKGLIKFRDNWGRQKANNCATKHIVLSYDAYLPWRKIVRVL